MEYSFEASLGEAEEDGQATLALAQELPLYKALPDAAATEAVGALYHAEELGYA